MGSHRAHDSHLGQSPHSSAQLPIPCAACGNWNACLFAQKVTDRLSPLRTRLHTGPGSNTQRTRRQLGVGECRAWAACGGVHFKIWNDLRNDTRGKGGKLNGARRRETIRAGRTGKLVFWKAKSCHGHAVAHRMSCWRGGGPLSSG